MARDRTVVTCYHRWPSLGSGVVTVFGVCRTSIIPSPPDLWAGIAIRELIANVADINEGLQARLLPNMCQPNTEVNKETLDVLNEFGMPLTETRLCLRTAHRQAAVYGGTVHDLGYKAAAAIVEINAITEEVKVILNLEERKPEVSHAKETQYEKRA